MRTPTLIENNKKNFGLTKDDFDRLVKALQLGDDQLFERIYLQHFERCLQYLINNCGADYETAYSSTMDALLEIRKDLIQGKIQYGNLAYFFTYRARKKFFKKRKPVFTSDITDENLPDNTDITQDIITKEMIGIVGQALGLLGEECRKLVKLYYYDNMTWPQIARVYYPDEANDVIETKSNTLKRRTSRKCLPTFKNILKKLM